MHAEHGWGAPQATRVLHAAGLAVRRGEEEARSAHAAGEGLQKACAWFVWGYSARSVPLAFGQILLALPSQRLGFGL